MCSDKFSLKLALVMDL